MTENEILLEWEDAARLAEMALNNLAFNLRAHRVGSRSISGYLGGANLDVLLARLKVAGLELWMDHCTAGGGLDRLVEMITKRKNPLGYHVYVDKEAT